MANANLSKAKNAKQDEFYTQYADIEKEVNAYLEYNPDTFRDKVVLLPCDDPEWSNFTRYFALHFEDLGLRKLISTSYAPDSKILKEPLQLTLFETESPQFDPSKAQTKGKLFILDRDVDGNGRIDIDDLQWHYLEGDGDFRSPEVKAFRDESDIIVTNPPFSLFREFFAWVMESGKKFLMICNKNCITYKEVFPHIMYNKVWIGTMNMGVDMLFGLPKEFADDMIENEKVGSKYRIINGIILGRSASCWITNIDHGRRHQPLPLMTMAENLKFSKHKDIKERKEYAHYDNYDAIEVPYVDAIPADYEGCMGVPITFLDKYCPEQFEILGMCENENLYNLKTKKYTSEECKQAYLDKFGKKGTYDLNASGVIYIDGRREKVYQRILIRKAKNYECNT